MLSLNMTADSLKVILRESLRYECAISDAPFFLGPAKCQIVGVRAQQDALHPLGIAPIAGPSILGGRGDHACPHWIEFDIAIATQEVIIAVDEARLVPALPQSTAAAILVVDISYIAAPQ
jgi:hypothetical protein